MRKEGDDFKKDYLGYGPSTAIVTDQVFQTLTKKSTEFWQNSQIMPTSTFRRTSSYPDLI